MTSKLLILMVLAFGLYWGFKWLFNSFQNHEEPIYRIIYQEKPFEIREYEEMNVISTDISGTRQKSIQSGFRYLFAYISGQNTQKKKISMTRPVMQIAHLGNWRIEFPLPRYLAEEAIPLPNNPDVSIQKIQKTRYAVIRFSGTIRDKILNQKLEDLKTFIIKRNCKIQYYPLYAFYNPPWTPSFLKRNEIWLQIDDAC
jgi:DNA gyrase inhibitor GyrI